MTNLNTAELRSMLDVAYRRIRRLRTEISAGRDEGGRNRRALDRIELYASVLQRLNRADALMPEIASAQERHHLPDPCGKR